MRSCPQEIRRPDARIAFAMPPCIGTNIMMVMREGIVDTMRASRHPKMNTLSAQQQ